MHLDLELGLETMGTEKKRQNKFVKIEVINRKLRIIPNETLTTQRIIVTLTSSLICLQYFLKGKTNKKDQHLRSFELLCIWLESCKIQFLKIFKEKGRK